MTAEDRSSPARPGPGRVPGGGGLMTAEDRSSPARPGPGRVPGGGADDG